MHQGQSRTDAGGQAIFAAVVTAAPAYGADLVMPATLSKGGQLVEKPFSVAEADWQFASPTGGFVDATDHQIAAAVAGARNYCTALQVTNSHATVSTEIVVKDGATVIWRGFVKAAMVNADPHIFPTPLRGSVNAALNFTCGTTGSAVIVSAQGYVGQ